MVQLLVALYGNITSEFQQLGYDVGDPSSAFSMAWAGWGEGEPCINQWPGVICCPNTHRFYWSQEGQCADDPDPKSRRRRLDGARRLELTAPTGGVQACHSGSITGVAAFDNAVCAVVKLDLRGMLPSGGRFPHALCALEELQELDVSDNSLTGPLPQHEVRSREFQMLTFGWLKRLRLRACACACACASRACRGSPRSSSTWRAHSVTHTATC